MRVLPVLALIAALDLAPPARAQLPAPGSLLVFPEFDNTPGHKTFLTLTNTNEDPFNGSVEIRLTLVNGAGPVVGLCNLADFTRQLTASDTVTLDTSAMSPSGFVRGFVYVYAQNRVTHQPMSFNHIIGFSTTLDAATGSAYSITPAVFWSVTPEGQMTDVDADGVRDLNGVEYAQAADRIIIPRFLGQDPGFTSSLLLVSLTGGRQFTLLLDFFYWNDNEEPNSLEGFEFSCWARVPLTSISGGFSQSFLQAGNDSPSESVAGRESGWILIDGNLAFSTMTVIQDPAFLAFLIEPNSQASSAPPFAAGFQSNGDLLPLSPLGDGN